MQNFQNAVAVVTGGASGIGKGIVQALLERDAQVVVADRDAQALEAIASELDIFPVETDVTDAASVENLAQQTLKRFGEVHILCNNAGVGPRGDISDMSLSDWRWIIDVNLWGVIHGLHYFLPHLTRNNGFAHIVNTVSMSVLTPPAGLAPYVGSKAGVLGITEVLRQELENDGSSVGVTALIPGPVTTNINNSLRNLPEHTSSALQDFNLSQKRPTWNFLPPRQVGEQVIESIIENSPYLITHSFFEDQIQKRHDEILAGIVRPSDKVVSLERGRS